MARFLLCSLVIITLAVLVLCADKNATTTESSVTTSSTTAKPTAAPQTSFFGELFKAAADIPKAIFATCIDTSTAFMNLLRK